MMPRTAPLALALALTLALTTAAPLADAQAAQRPGAERRDGDRDRDRERERRAMDDRDYEGLGLNDAQRGQLRAIDEENRVAMARLSAATTCSTSARSSAAPASPTSKAKIPEMITPCSAARTASSSARCSVAASPNTSTASVFACVIDTLPLVRMWPLWTLSVVVSAFQRPGIAAIPPGLPIV